MSQVVTPPDIVNKGTVYLIVNAHAWDIEMIVRWLQISRKDYTIHLYHDGMNDSTWLDKVAKESHTILVNRLGSNANSINALLDQVAKIKWFGENQDYLNAMEYLVKNG